MSKTKHNFMKERFKSAFRSQMLEFPDNGSHNLSHHIKGFVTITCDAICGSVYGVADCPDKIRQIGSVAGHDVVYKHFVHIITLNVKAGGSVDKKNVGRVEW